MGRNAKLVSDPALGKVHAAGASVQVIQILAHAQLGALSYVFPSFWRFHWRSAVRKSRRLREAHEEVLTLPVGPSRMRTLDDMEFLGEVYDTGTSMLSDVVRAVQHLCQEIEGVTRVELTASTVEARLGQASNAASLTLDNSSAGYAAFIEMARLRDAVEHPKESNVYGREGKWDEVPLAWLLSDRSLRAFERYNEWFTRMAGEWEIARKEYAGTWQLTVQRGIKSQLQHKKPPSEGGALS